MWSNRYSFVTENVCTEKSIDGKRCSYKLKLSRFAFSVLIGELFHIRNSYVMSSQLNNEKMYELIRSGLNARKELKMTCTVGTQAKLACVNPIKRIEDPKQLYADYNKRFILFTSRTVILWTSGIVANCTA